LEILEVPFNKFIGLKECTDPNFILELPDSKKFLNSNNTVHSGALFALAEASSNRYLKYLLDSVKDIDYYLSPAIQNVKIKFRNPAEGRILSKTRILGKGFQELCDELKSKKRVVLEIEVKLLNPENEVVMIAKFEWKININKD
jgi:acyl-coenzyme A thioesterase PaaI-like protein